MSDDKTMKQVGFEVEVDAWETAKRKSEWGEMSQELRKTVHEKAYGTEVTERKRLQDKRDSKRSEVQTIDAEINRLENKRGEIQRDIQRIDSRLDVLMEQDGEYDGFLQALESDLKDGQRFDAGHGKIERAADLGDCEPSDVIDALKERNPAVPDVAFRLPKAHEPPNWKEIQHR